MNRAAAFVILCPVQGLLDADVLRFAAVIIAGALMFLTHYLVSKTVYSDPETPPILRLISVIPPITPILAFMRGKRAAAFVWFGMLAVYITVRVVAS